MAAQPTIVNCRDGCGRSVEIDHAKGEIEPPAGEWVFLPIQKSWRCIACVRILEQCDTSRGGVDEQHGA